MKDVYDGLPTGLRESLHHHAKRMNLDPGSMLVAEILWPWVEQADLEEYTLGRDVLILQTPNWPNGNRMRGLDPGVVGQIVEVEWFYFEVDFSGRRRRLSKHDRGIIWCMADEVEDGHIEFTMTGSP